MSEQQYASAEIMAENAALHEQVAANADEIQKLKDRLALYEGEVKPVTVRLRAEDHASPVLDRLRQMAALLSGMSVAKIRDDASPEDLVAMMQASAGYNLPLLAPGEHLQFVATPPDEIEHEIAAVIRMFGSPTMKTLPEGAMHGGQGGVILYDADGLPGVVDAILRILSREVTQAVTGQHPRSFPVGTMIDPCAVFQPVDRIHHRKRGGDYDVLTYHGHMQISRPELLYDGCRVGIYRGEDGGVHVRAMAELQDGRFVRGLKEPWSSEPATLRPSYYRTLRQANALKLCSDIWGDAALDPAERLRRVIEEAEEFVQAALAAGVQVERRQIDAIRANVWSRPAGEFDQEAGGLSLTVLGLCAVMGVSAEEAEVREIKRVQAKDRNALRARHQAKVDAGLAMQGIRPETEGCVPECSGTGPCLCHPRGDMPEDGTTLSRDNAATA